jgi:hypothetical protein
MKVDSLPELKAAFADWRAVKRYRREPVPPVLLERALRAIGTHGMTAVVKSTGISWEKLRRVEKAQVAALVPAYSRVNIAAPKPTHAPEVEVEMVSGVKFRAYVMSEATVGLVTALCQIGGAL